MFEQVAGQIKTARGAAELTQVQLAEAIGVTPRAVAHWEGGTRQPKARYLRAIAQTTGKPLTFFFEEVAEEVVAAA